MCFLLKKHLILVPKRSYGFGGYPPPPLYGQNFQRKGGYGFGGYSSPPPFKDKICKVVFDSLPRKGVVYLISLQTIKTDYLKVVPNIPSRFTAAKRHTAVLAYVPVGVPEESESPGLPPWHLLPPPSGQSYSSSPEVQRIKSWICGPRANNICVPGARTTVCLTCSFMSYD